MRAGSSVIDITGGMFGVIGILSALEQRHQSGRGQHVTSSLFETTAFMVGQHMAQQAVLGEAPPPMSVRRSAWAIYDIFDTKGGEQIFVGVVSDTQWQLLCKHFELDEFANDNELASNNGRVTQRERIIPVIRALFATMTPEQLSAKLEQAGLPFASINKPSDLFDDPHLNTGNGLLKITLSDGSTAKLPGLPLEMQGNRPGLRIDLPKEGAHTRQTLEQLGYTPIDIDNLIKDNIVYDLK
jgi:crotonobetainyl-CoA:carnitine CoA-transferase CaiB-like acyl-CoA transferase